MSDAKVLFDVQDSIARITLNRPEKLNALDMEMLVELEAVLTQLDQSRSVRVVIITGAGDRAFCVGADIYAWSALKPLDMWRQWIREGHRRFDRVARLRQPVIAALNGYTFGGGLELALAADLRIANETAQLALPEVSLGTIPGWAGTQRLPALIGPARAKQMIFTGARVSAAQAAQWGLVNEVVAPEALLTRAVELAGKIAANAPIAVQLAKQLIDGAEGKGAGLALEGAASALAAYSEDLAEGLAAFQEKRQPKFKGT